MRILGAVFFLSLLAGKFATFEQMLLTEKITKYAYYNRSYFSKFFGGKLKTFKQSITRVKLTKNYLLSFRIKSSSLSNRSQIWPFIFLREKHLICFVPLSKSFLSPVNKSSSCLIRDWSISDIHQSVCKKKKINNKSTEAMDLIEYNSCG